jgi:hypothetical protein
MRIGIHNAEEVLFSDPGPWAKIPELRGFRDQWALSRMSPHLRQTGRRAVLEFLEAAGAPHESALSDHFGEEVTIDKARHRTVENLSFRVDDHPPMDEGWDYSGFGCHREGDTIKITFWR